jgi:hypothetical protein
MGCGPDFAAIRRATSLDSGSADGGFHAFGGVRDEYKIRLI